MSSAYSVLKDKIYQNLIKPVVESVSPVKEAAIGSAIGMFVGMTPTVGIQMWVVFMIWLFFKYVLKIRFDLVIGTALVWISNPLTLIFLYYGFLVTGNYAFSMLGMTTVEISYASFELELSGIINHPDHGSWQKFLDGCQFLLVDLGFPMIFGSLFYAIPLAIASYFFTLKYLQSYRINKAAKLGMDYETWRKKYERSGD